MISTGNQVVECPVCAMVTTEPACPRCQWSLRNTFSLDVFEPWESIDDAKTRWNLQAAVRAAGPCKPSGEEIERFCALAGIPVNTPDGWMSRVQPVYDRIYNAAGNDSSFNDWLTKHAQELSKRPGTSLGVVEISVDGIARCRISSTKWGALQRADFVLAPWREVIPDTPSDPIHVRFFLAGGRLNAFPSGMDIITSLSTWVPRSINAIGELAVCNRLPGWIVPELLIERLGSGA